MSHYFENDKNLKNKENKIYVMVGKKKFCFLVNYGVFSKKGLDFGTRTLLESINLNNIKGDILDFGCGYGPIGIYLSKMTKSKIDMVDINKRCISLSLKNAKLNDADVNIFESNGYENITRKYDYIITNPPIRVGKAILYQLLLGAKNYLKQEGKLIFVMHKDQGAKSTIEKLKQEYAVKIVGKNKGFYVIEGKLIDKI